MKKLTFLVASHLAFLGCTSVRIEKTFVTKNDHVVFTVKSKNAYQITCGLPIELYRKVGSLYEPMEKYVPRENQGPYKLDGEIYPGPEIMDEGCDVLECVKRAEVDHIEIPIKIYRILDQAPLQEYETSSLKGQFRIDLPYYDNAACKNPKNASLEFER